LCVISWLPKGELNPQGVQSQLWFHFAREVCPEFSPRVTFLREHFWADGFELARTVENPEPFLSPLPSSRTVSSEIECIQRSSSRFPGRFFSSKYMRFESVSIRQSAHHFSKPVFQIPSACPTLCFKFLLKPLINHHTGMENLISFHFVNDQIWIRFE
jgi:hypothetical protein